MLMRVAVKDAPAGGNRRACVSQAASAAQSAEGVPERVDGSAVYAYALARSNVITSMLCVCAEGVASYAVLTLTPHLDSVVQDS